LNRVLENSTASGNRSDWKRQAAESALDQYGMPGARLTLIGDGDCTVFRVDLPQQPRFERHPYLGRTARWRFVLRLHHDESQAAATLTELLLLAALLRDTDLAVPEPVPTRSGLLLAPACAPGSPDGAYAVLLRWVEGSMPEDGQQLDALNYPTREALVELP
jgi:hypothetical protein